MVPLIKIHSGPIGYRKIIEVMATAQVTIGRPEGVRTAGYDIVAESRKRTCPDPGFLGIRAGRLKSGEGYIVTGSTVKIQRMALRPGSQAEH
jgi:hypothetical protein